MKSNKAKIKQEMNFSAKTLKLMAKMGHTSLEKVAKNVIKQNIIGFLSGMIFQEVKDWRDHLIL